MTLSRARRQEVSQAFGVRHDSTTFTASLRSPRESIGSEATTCRFAIIEETGWIIVDTLTATETAKAAMDLARKHLDNEDNKKPIKAIIYTHSHIDHFGGVLGVISADEARKNQVRVIAPEGFTEEATSENILVGLAMGRRATMMYGKQLSRTKRGHVGSGLGKSPAYGTFTFLTPTEIIDQTPQTLTIDGLEFVFQYAPESEAPAELTFYLPQRKAFCGGAELVSRNLHNLYTLRGAEFVMPSSGAARFTRCASFFQKRRFILRATTGPCGDGRPLTSFSSVRQTFTNTFTTRVCG